MLKHDIFGRFERADFADLADLHTTDRNVSVCLYLPETHVAAFDPQMLDAFVPLRKRLEGDLAPLIPSLLPLRDDWVENWLDPANSNVAAPFHAAFPTAKATRNIPEAAFANALWLSAVMIAPFGSSGQAGAPVATLDFRVLAEEDDNTVFVLRLAPDGTVVEATTET